MAVAETARLIASLELDSRKFNANADKAIGKLGKISTKSIAVGTAVGVGMQRLAEAGIRKVFGAISGGLDSLGKVEDATTSLDGAIAQVGKGWTITGSQIAAEAVKIETAVQSAFDDKDIAQATTTLIRYGGVTQEQLPLAMQVMTDLAAKTGDVGSASEALAKAMADPTKASRLLRQAGVALTKDQQKQIQAWVDSGDKAKAQAYLLGLVEDKVKGAAAAMHGPLVDAQLELHDAVEEAQKALAVGLLPVLTEVRKELTEQLAKPETLARIKKFGEGLAGGFRDAVTFIKQIPWDQVMGVLKGAADFGSNIAHAFTSLPSEAKGLILGLAALNKLSGGAVINVGVDILKGAGGALFQQFLGKGSAANPLFVIDVGGTAAGSAPAVGGAAGGVAKAGIGAVGKMFLVGEAIGLVAAVAGVADAVKDGLTGNAQSIHETLKTSLASPQTVDDLRTKLGAIDTGISKLPTDPIGGWVTSGALGELQGMRTDVVAALGKLGTENLQPLPDRISAKQASAFAALRDKMEANRISTVTALGSVKMATDTARINTIAAQRTGDSAVIRAIKANRPIVNVRVNMATRVNVYRTGTTIKTDSSAHSVGADIGK